MKKLLILIVLVGFIVSCGNKNAETKNDTPTQSTETKKDETSFTASVGQTIPDYNVIDMDQNEKNIKDLIDTSKKTLFVVAAEWCPHCREEAEDIQKFYNENKDSANVIVIYTSYKTNFDITKKYIDETNQTYPVFYDKDGGMIELFAIQGFPFNMILEGQTIVERIEGGLTFDEMIKSLK